MIKNLVKNIYYFLFPLYKLIKYPTCKIYTNHIHPDSIIGKYVEIQKYCKIDRNVDIGNYTYINEYTRIDANTKSIGKFCSISHNVKIGMGPHPLHFVSTSPIFYAKSRGYVNNDFYNEYKDKGYTVIGHDVFIAANVIIYAGISIGTGAVVAAGSVVTKDIPPYAFAAGVPAKIIKYRFDEKTINKLLSSKWWEKDVNILLQKVQLMEYPQKWLQEIYFTRID